MGNTFRLQRRLAGGANALEGVFGRGRTPAFRCPVTRRRDHGLCREFGISRKTGYKIFDRYKEHGLHALTDRSLRPVHYANQLPVQVETLIVSLKRNKPHWGARKIRELLLRRLPGDVRLPAKSTIHVARGSHRLLNRARSSKRSKRAASTTIASQLFSRIYSWVAETDGINCANFAAGLKQHRKGPTPAHADRRRRDPRCVAPAARAGPADREAVVIRGEDIDLDTRVPAGRTEANAPVAVAEARRATDRRAPAAHVSREELSTRLSRDGVGLLKP
jgi:hypothetical protein